MKAEKVLQNIHSSDLLCFIQLVTREPGFDPDPSTLDSESFTYITYHFSKAVRILL